MTGTTRLLLPFSHGVEMGALEAAVQLAAGHHATLVPLSLVPVPQANGRGARLEHIQQSKDFLEATQQKALRLRVPLERFEAFSGDVVQSIAVLVHQLACDGMILVLRGRSGCLLSGEMIGQLVAMRPCTLFLLYLPAREPSWATRLRERFSRLRSGHRQRAEKSTRPSPAPAGRALQEVVLSRYGGPPDLEGSSRP